MEQKEAKHVQPSPPPDPDHRIEMFKDWGDGVNFTRYAEVIGALMVNMGDKIVAIKHKTQS